MTSAHQFAEDALALLKLRVGEADIDNGVSDRQTLLEVAVKIVEDLSRLETDARLSDHLATAINNLTSYGVYKGDEP